MYLRDFLIAGELPSSRPHRKTVLGTSTMPSPKPGCTRYFCPSDPMLWYPLAVKGRNVLVRHNVSFRSGVLPDCSRNLWAQRKMHKRDGRSLHVPIWMVCRASYLEDLIVRANARVRGLV
jgi:hypothetical protein